MNHVRMMAIMMMTSLCVTHGIAADNAITTPRVESFPREGKGYTLIDWHQRAQDFITFTLDPVRKGEYLPLMWWNDSKTDSKQKTFGLTSYVGMKNQWGVFGNSHEGIVTMGILLSGTLLGKDMTRYVVPGSEQPVNLVQMQEAYFSSADGVFLNRIHGNSGGSFWYDLAPSLYMGALIASYPQEKALTDKWHTSCERWSKATLQLWHLNDFSFQAYDLRSQRATAQRWREPDSAAALAYLMQMAYAKWPEEKAFYHETRHALDWLCSQERNINYEFFPSYGVYAAARCNAEHGTSYDVGKVFGWCFEDSAVRGISAHEKDVSKGDGWGVVCGQWGDADVAGLVGVSRGALSTPKFRGGYAFVMETFAYAWPLVAATRYDNRLARAVGKWMHAAAHSARFFYPDQLPPEKQTDWSWASKYTCAIPYEGLMEKNNSTGEPGPFASGDPSNHGWGPMNLGIYSGALSGVFGALIQPTNVKGVLALDVNKTDFFAKPSFPTTLLYNPLLTPVKVNLSVGDKPVRVWDAVSNSWLSDSVTDRVDITIAPDAAVLATRIPADLKTRFEHGKLYAGNIIADYSATPPAPSIPRRQPSN
jgi:hypothetical protein